MIQYGDFLADQRMNLLSGGFLVLAALGKGDLRHAREAHLCNSPARN